MTLPDDTRVQPHTISNMNFNFNLIFVSILAMVLMAGQASATNWTIDGNAVYVNDSNVYITVSPHTLIESGNIIVNLTSKKYTGDIDVIFGFDVPNVKPISAGLYNPTYSNVTKSYTCSPPNWFNYTLSPKQFNCWYNQSTPIVDNQTNETTYINTTVLVFNHSFETANLTAKTAYWNEIVFTEYTDVSSAFTKLSYEYGGMNTWYLRKNVAVIANQSKQLKVTVQVPIKLGTHSGKYWIAIKPSGEALATAILNGHLYVLDPWYNTSWNRKKPILLNNTGNATTLTDFQVNLNVTYDSDMNNDGSDLRPVNDTSGLAHSYWLDSNNSVNGSYFNLWIKASSISASVWDNTTNSLYYGNPSAASASNGTDTFVFFDDFSGNAIDTSKWTVDGAGGLTVEDGEVKMVQADGKIRSVPSFSQPFVIETKLRSLIPTSGQGFAPIGTWTNITSAVGLQSYGTLAGVSYKFVDGAWTDIANEGDNTNPRIYTMSSNTGNVVFNILSSNRTNIGWTYTQSYTVSSQQIRLGQRYDNGGTTEAQDERWDWLLVRKYASPEPNALLGEEEESSAKPRVQVIIIG